MGAQHEAWRSVGGGGPSRTGGRRELRMGRGPPGEGMRVSPWLLLAHLPGGVGPPRTGSVFKAQSTIKGSRPRAGVAPASLATLFGSEYMASEGRTGHHSETLTRPHASDRLLTTCGCAVGPQDLPKHRSRFLKEPTPGTHPNKPVCCPAFATWETW
eukprot:scaffold3791_cov390-Prasinococcus_capsulatus_cf.AAC.3